MRERPFMLAKQTFTEKWRVPNFGRSQKYAATLSGSFTCSLTVSFVPYMPCWCK
jgi:hypothetical protein